MIIMNPLENVFMDLLNATIMQISIWIWEMNMIAKFGFNWRYREFW